MTLTPSTVISQLQTYLPRYTDELSQLLTITSASVSGNTVTVNAPAHGLISGAMVSVVAGLAQNKITGYADNGDGTVRFTTEAPHDLTAPRLFLDAQNLTISGFAAPWAGVFKIVSIPSSTTFEVSKPSGAGVPSGTGYLIEDRPLGLRGIFPVTVVSAGTFTYQTRGLAYPANPVIGLKICKGLRIAGAADIKRAEAAYGTFQKSNVSAAFVIMTDTSTSKDRRAESDLKSATTIGTAKRITMIDTFSVVVFIPTQNDLTGYRAQELAYGPLYNAMQASLFGAFKASGGFEATMVGHGAGSYNTSYYSHVYEFELGRHEDWTSGFIPQETVAIHNLDVELVPFGIEPEKLLLDINLPQDVQP